MPTMELGRIMSNFEASYINSTMDFIADVM